MIVGKIVFVIVLYLLLANSGIAGLLNGQVRSNASDYKDQYGVYEFRVNNKGRERILEF